MLNSICCCMLFGMLRGLPKQWLRPQLPLSTKLASSKRVLMFYSAAIDAALPKFIMYFRMIASTKGNARTE